MGWGPICRSFVTNIFNIFKNIASVSVGGVSAGELSWICAISEIVRNRSNSMNSLIGNQIEWKLGRFPKTSKTNSGLKLVALLCFEFSQGHVMLYE